jgi:uncharacterized membrane protein
MRDMPEPRLDADTSASLFNWTQAIYGLHAFSLLTGILGAATVIGAFLTGWPSLIAVILNYVKRGDVRGTWLESHFRWQIRTFWYGLLWVSLCLLFGARDVRNRYCRRVAAAGGCQRLVRVPNRAGLARAPGPAADVRGVTAGIEVCTNLRIFESTISLRQFVNP